MDMIDLVLTVCLISDPSQCRVERLHFETQGSLLQCMFLAPSQVAKWSESHPKFRVARWRCAFPEKEQHI